MSTIRGIVTIAQESRFQLLDDDGVAHMLVLGHAAAAEPDQLADLAARQARVLVRTKDAAGVIGEVATAIRAL